jgi:hypothetical protein
MSNGLFSSAGISSPIGVFEAGAADGEAGDDDGELGQLAGRIAEGLRLEEAVDRGAEAHDRDDEGQKRDGVVRPALGQDLADQMIGDVVVAQALDAFLEAHEALPPKPDCVGEKAGSGRRAAGRFPFPLPMPPISRPPGGTSDPSRYPA